MRVFVCECESEWAQAGERAHARVRSIKSVSVILLSDRARLTHIPSQNHRNHVPMYSASFIVPKMFLWISFDLSILLVSWCTLFWLDVRCFFSLFFFLSFSHDRFMWYRDYGLINSRFNKFFWLQKYPENLFTWLYFLDAEIKYHLFPFNAMQITSEHFFCWMRKIRSLPTYFWSNAIFWWQTFFVFRWILIETHTKKLMHNFYVTNLYNVSGKLCPCSLISERGGETDKKTIKTITNMINTRHTQI